MKFELEDYHRNITEAELLNDLKSVSELLKKQTFTLDEYKKCGKYSPDTHRRRFGSWDNALKKAGLKRYRNYGTSEEEYLQNIGEIWIKLGRQPYFSDMTIPFSKYSGTAYLHKFGKWRTALDKFIKYANTNEVFSQNENVGNVKVEPVTRNRTKRDINWRLRFIVMKRDNFKCQYCGQSPATDPTIILHVDHKTPYSKGGETVPENLQTLCSKCNIGKSDLHQ